MKRKTTLICLSTLAAIFSLAIGGCAMPFSSDTGQLNMTSQAADHLQITGQFDQAYYRFDSSNRVTVVLIDGPANSPRRAAVIRLFWQPFAGYTPVDPAATNATVQYVVFGDSPTSAAGADTQVGVYSGAGFVYPDNSPGDTTLRAGVWQASVRLTDRSKGYTDQLGASNVHGSFAATRDSEKVQQILRQVNVEVAARLGYPRMVRNEHRRPEQPDLRLARLDDR